MKYCILILAILLNISQLDGQRKSREDKVNIDSYGANATAYGFNLFGTGIAGFSFKKTQKNHNQLEASLGLGGRFEVDSRSAVSINDYLPTADLILGYNIFLGHKKVDYKRKIKKNFISPKVGVALGESIGTFAILT